MLDRWSIDKTPKRPTPQWFADAYKNSKGVTKGWIKDQAKHWIREWDRLYADLKPAKSDEAIARMLALMAADTAGEDEDGECSHGAFRYAVRPWPKGGWTGVEVATLSFKSTPKSLYRALYLFAPSKLDVSDMYKTGAGMIAFTSPCRRFAVRLELWKYELAARFYVSPELAATRYVPLGRIDVVYNGPTVRKGRIDPARRFGTTDAAAQRFFEMVRVALTRRWMVYGGNDFFV